MTIVCCISDYYSYSKRFTQQANNYIPLFFSAVALFSMVVFQLHPRVNKSIHIKTLFIYNDSSHSNRFFLVYYFTYFYLFWLFLVTSCLVLKNNAHKDERWKLFRQIMETKRQFHLLYESSMEDCESFLDE